MQIEIPYEAMKRDYPQYLKKAIEKFQKKGKPFDERSLKYEMHWIQHIRACGIEEVGEIATGRKNLPKAFQDCYASATVENIREYFGSDIHWWIKVTNGDSCVKLQPVAQLPFPIEIAKTYVDEYTRHFPWKSAMLKETCEEKGIPAVNLECHELEPEDLRGLPAMSP